MPVHDPNTPTPLMATPTVNMPSSAPARKVLGATAGAGIGGVTAGLIVWALGAIAFPDGVPAEVQAFVGVIVPLVLSFAGGYVTRRSAAEVASLQQPAPDLAALVDAHSKPAPAKKAAAKRPAKKAAPKPPSGLS
jgi:hypothetical protein